MTISNGRCRITREFRAEIIPPMTACFVPDLGAIPLPSRRNSFNPLEILKGSAYHDCNIHITRIPQGSKVHTIHPSMKGVIPPSTDRKGSYDIHHPPSNHGSPSNLGPRRRSARLKRLNPLPAPCILILPHASPIWSKSLTSLAIATLTNAGSQLEATSNRQAYASLPC